MTWLAVRIRLCSLPAGLGWGSVFVVGAVAGIGFTMAIFITELAFTSPALLGVAKLGVLSATAIAAAIGLVAGNVILRPTYDSDCNVWAGSGRAFCSALAFSPNAPRA